MSDTTDIVPGIRTSEGIVSAVAAAAPLVTALAAHLEGWQLVAVLGIAGAVACVYAMCRTYLKAHGVQS